MDQLTAMGAAGTVLLLQRGYKTLSWNDTDFRLDIQVKHTQLRLLVNADPRDRCVRTADVSPHSSPLREVSRNVPQRR